MILKEISDGLAAVAAFGAAGAWFWAARAPTAFITFPSYSDPSAVCAAIEAYKGFVQGTVWNKRAAIMAGISALFSFVSWTVS